jgi:hypothetical protein
MSEPAPRYEAACPGIQEMIVMKAIPMKREPCGGKGERGGRGVRGGGAQAGAAAASREGGPRALARARCAAPHLDPAREEQRHERAAAEAEPHRRRAHDAAVARVRLHQPRPPGEVLGGRRARVQRGAGGGGAHRLGQVGVDRDAVLHRAPAQGEQRVVVEDDDAQVAEARECEEEADADGRRKRDVGREALDEPAAHAGQREEEEDPALDEDRRERLRVGQVALADDLVRDVDVDAWRGVEWVGGRVG